MVSMVFLAVYGFKGFFCMFSIVHFIFSIYTVCVFVCTLVVNVNNIFINLQTIVWFTLQGMLRMLTIFCRIPDPGTWSHRLF